MKPCSEYLEDLALAAGADLAPGDERRVLSHAETCGGCAALLAGLMRDQGLLTRAGSRADDRLVACESLLPALMARVATEAHEQAVHRQVLASAAAHGGGTAGPRAASLGPDRLGAFLRMAVAVAAVISVGFLGLATLQHEQIASAPGAGSTSGEGTQISVRRLPGEAIELSWAGDGREGAETAAGRPYTVLASADPRDFQAAKAVEVAGRRLVTDLPLPAARARDRKITYFRVE